MEMKLTCETRSEKKKNASGRLRNQGLIPANFINEGISNPIKVQEKDFIHLLNNGLRQSSLIDLTVGGESKRVVVKEIQRNPVSGNILHIDFFGAREDKMVKVNIGIELEGTAKGVKKGGALEHYVRYLKTRSKPSDLQDIIKVDISNLDVGDAIYYKDLKLNENWDIRITGNPIIARVAKSRLSAVAGDEGAGAEQKPEEEKK
ncbi:MAG: 50S ribosomal protein L25 [Spirochaetia bacterium]|nr:50S ribosomal protein L25 [Spirochaetia bacterium]